MITVHASTPRIEAAMARYNIKNSTAIQVGDLIMFSGLTGLDLETGEQSWRFDTIARPGEPGGNTWNDVPLDKRSGGSVWHQGTYDPELDLVLSLPLTTTTTTTTTTAVSRSSITH